MEEVDNKYEQRYSKRKKPSEYQSKWKERMSTKKRKRTAGNEKGRQRLKNFKKKKRK